MDSNEKTLQELFEEIQKSKGQVRESLMNEMAFQIYVLFCSSKLRYKIKKQSGQNFSDVVQIALRSFMSDIEHDRLGAKECWEGFALGFLRNKIDIHIRDTKVLNLVDSDLLPEDYEGQESNDCEQVIEDIAQVLPIEDKTKLLFIEIAKGKLTLKEIAEKVSLSERRVNDKKTAIISHFADLFLDNESLDSETKETIKLLFDPRKRIPAAKQEKSKRLSGMERRIIAAADKIGISKEEMTKRAESALRKLTRLLNDLET